jgi:hypothetical protein
VVVVSGHIDVCLDIYVASNWIGSMHEDKIHGMKLLELICQNVMLYELACLDVISHVVLVPICKTLSPPDQFETSTYTILHTSDIVN